MPKSHRPYPPAFRRQMVELVRRGRTPEELAREFEPSAQAIRGWVNRLCVTLAAQKSSHTGSGVSSVNPLATQATGRDRITQDKLSSRFNLVPGP